jgi:hypothetical protein
MSAMKQLWENINYLLDTTHLLCQEIADELDCPVEMVNDIVHQRFMERVGL